MNIMSKSDTDGAELTRDLYQRGMIKTWLRDQPEGWKLISGLWSPFYIQLRMLPAYPDTLKRVGEALGGLIREQIPEATVVVGIAMAGIPIAVATAISAGFPCAMTRKLEGVRSVADFDTTIKSYGEHNLVEGQFRSGDRVVLIDDLVTKFDSKLIAKLQVEHETNRQSLKNVICQDVVVIFDREQGAEETARKAGMNLYSLIPFRSKALDWLSGVMSPRELDVIRDYLSDSARYQEKNFQDKLKQEARTRHQN